MIYEVRTYDIKPGTLIEVEKRFAESYQSRKKYSELIAFWHTEIGPLNQVISVWPYDSLEARERTRAAAQKDPNWPPKIGEFVTGMRADIVTPAPFSPEMKAGKIGPFFEMRTYTYPSGEFATLMENWENALPQRSQFGPVCAIWYSELGALNQWTHVWPYESLNQRTESRAKAVAAGAWPPGAVAVKQGRKAATYLKQENKILMPAAFSPIQ